MTRSYSVPVNVKSVNLRRNDSGGIVRVISVTQRTASIDGALPDDAQATESGKPSLFLFNFILF